MIITTTPSVEGRAIREYKGIVFGEVISGVNFMKDLRAAAMGANAVIGVDIDYEVLGADNGMLMVTASGTAVVVD